MRLSARVALRIAAVAAVCMLGSACSSEQSTTQHSSAQRHATDRSVSIVALGDSVPRGTHCDCTPYPALTAKDLASGTEWRVTDTNDAVAGATSADVLRQLDSDQAVIDHVRTAGAIEIEIGANDVSYSKSCGTNVDCYSPHLPALEQNLAAIVARAHKLTAGHKVALVLLDYWSVWLGGEYADAKGPSYVSAAEAMTDKVDSIIKTTAADSGSYYVDLRAAFKGPNYDEDETQFLSSDGDHPNAAGHEQIAKAVDAVLDKALK